MAPSSLTRRELLVAAGSSFVCMRQGRLAAQGEAPARIAAVIGEYESQGFHRTATGVDQASAQWLASQVERAGLKPTLEPFNLSRVDPLVSSLEGGGRRIVGLPLFDAAFTPQSGVSGRLGPLNSSAEIGLTDTAVNAAGSGALGDARRANQHKAIVAITRGRRPGLCPSNADSFLSPFGPPVLQVSSEEREWLTDHANRGTKVQLIVSVARNDAVAQNVTAELTGSDTTLAPIVVMTPRSGWYWCASERGGGIACWLEIMRGLRVTPLKRSVLFVASSGHELGHLGIDAFIHQRPGIVKRASAWLHLGANIGAATDLANNLLQASDDDMDRRLTEAMTAAGLAIARRAPRTNVPAGEAEAVHRGGGRYVSSIGGNALFHHITDRGAAAVDPPTIAKFSAAYVAVIRTIDAA
jgi:hypothetical protein